MVTISLILLAVIAVGLTVVYLKRRSGTERIEKVSATEESPQLESTVSIPERGLKAELSRTRGGLAQKIGALLGRAGSESLEKDWEKLEEALLEADVGVRTTDWLLARVRESSKSADSKTLRETLEQECKRLFSSGSSGIEGLDRYSKPLVICIVGVNGAGKTTTVGKIAQHFTEKGKSVLLGAVDTFRAAAIGQLKVWAERTGAQIVLGREGGDPGAVAFDAVSAGVARGVDVVLLDTAGRLHTKKDLMEELKKIQRVVKKVVPEAPQETWLVLDGTAGQNSIQQAREFGESLGVSGIVITKLDGTAKGGAVLGIANELKLPIRFIGVGEAAQDLLPFESDRFIEAIFEN